MSTVSNDYNPAPSPVSAPMTEPGLQRAQPKRIAAITASLITAVFAISVAIPVVLAQLGAPALVLAITTTVATLGTVVSSMALGAAIARRAIENGPNQH